MQTMNDKISPWKLNNKGRIQKPEPRNPSIRGEYNYTSPTQPLSLLGPQQTRFQKELQKRIQMEENSLAVRYFLFPNEVSIHLSCQIVWSSKRAKEASSCARSQSQSRIDAIRWVAGLINQIANRLGRWSDE